MKLNLIAISLLLTAYSFGQNAGFTGQIGQGAWSFQTPYSQNQMVSYNGYFYVALIPNTNVTPGPSSTTWMGPISLPGLLRVNGNEGITTAFGNVEMFASSNTIFLPSAPYSGEIHTFLNSGSGAPIFSGNGKNICDLTGCSGSRTATYTNTGYTFIYDGTQWQVPNALSGLLQTGANCSSAASPAVCAAAPAGAAVIAAAATSVVINTTAVTANSQILVDEDQSLGTRLTVTCNTQSLVTLGTPRVSARTAGTSFTVIIDAAPTTNPMCLNYSIIN